MSEFSKLQIRAKVLSIVSEIKSTRNYNEDLLSKFVFELEQIDDREAIFDVFFKELIKMDEEESTFSSCILKLIVSKEYVNSKVLDALKSSLSDEAKYKLVQLLRIVGGDYDSTVISSYFENPEEVLDKETKRLLENAVFNPEAMLDFLDFVSAVSPRDRNLLLESLKFDYQGDVLANIVYPILYSDFEEKFVLDVINVLSDSKSSLAISPFNYLIETSNNEEIVNACKVGLKKLKLAGASEEKANEYFKNIIKDTTPADFYTTIPDGNGNQALLISRMNKNQKYLLAAVVVNDIFGIVDCFGFYNISSNELTKVIGKFYQSEGKYKVTPEYVKTKVDNAVALTIKNKRKFPYEYICWSALIKDLNPLEVCVSQNVNETSKRQLLSKDGLLTILTKEYTLRWFITPSESSDVKELVEYIYNLEDLNIDDINSKILDKIEKVFSQEVIEVWESRFYDLIYLLKNNNESKLADQFYTILQDENHFKLFKSVIMQRSIFSHFIALQENTKDSFLTANIFTKRNSAESKYDVKKLDSIVKFLKKNWLNE